MEPLHARYPFFEASRQAVGQADVDHLSLVAGDSPALARAVERVERALLEGRTDPEDPGRWSARDELLSYPVARILVSLLDDGRAVEKYAESEAATAAERFADDFESGVDLQSTERPAVDREAVLAEFDLADAVREEHDDRPSQAPTRFRVRVDRYLALSAAEEWGEAWRLVTRELADGAVRVEEDELNRLLQAAVRDRVASGLPFDLPEESEATFREALSAELSELRGLLGERERVGRIDAVIPELFPPCIEKLEDAAAERDLAPPESFALVSFLAAIGLDAEGVVRYCEGTTIGEEQIRYQVARVGDERGAQYPPPSCETLAAYGVCENEDDHRERASHPLALYQLNVAETPPEERTDWRRRGRSEGEA